MNIRWPFGAIFMKEKSVSDLTDAKLMEEIRSLTGFTQSQTADLLGYAGNRAVRAIETGEKEMSGPARMAAEYLAMGLLDEEMKKIVPEFGFMASAASPESGELLFRNYFPRFVGLVHYHEIDGLVNIEVLPDPIILTVINWVDKPTHSDMETIMKRAAGFVEDAYQLGE